CQMRGCRSVGVATTRFGPERNAECKAVLIERIGGERNGFEREQLSAYDARIVAFAVQPGAHGQQIPETDVRLGGIAQRERFGKIFLRKDFLVETLWEVSALFLEH